MALIQIIEIHPVSAWFDDAEQIEGTVVEIDSLKDQIYPMTYHGIKGFSLDGCRVINSRYEFCENFSDYNRLTIIVTKYKVLFK